MTQYHLYISFGSDHQHHVLGKTVGGSRQLAKIPCDNHSQGRAIAFALFGDKFCTSYEQVEVDQSSMVNDIVKMFEIL